ncbi:MAG: hypothetical protein ACYC2P_13220 [Paludibacteraceae bacterium]
MLKISHYGRIHKMETPTLIKGVNAILKNYDREALDIKIWCDLLLNQESELGEITEINRRNPAMKELNTYRKARRSLLSVINTHYSALERAQVNSLAAQLEVVIPFLNRFVRNLVSNNFKKMNEIVIQMLHIVNEDVSLQSALEVVGLKVYFDELNLIQNNITLCKSRIVKFKSEIPKMRTEAIKKEAVNALNNLIMSIELGKIKHPELDYTPLTNELNVFLGEFQALDKTRRTISKNSAENKKTAAMSPTTTATAI